MKNFLLITLFACGFSADTYRLESKGDISLGNKDPDKVMLWFHCTKWDHARENFKWNLIISRHDVVLKTHALGYVDGSTDSGSSFSGGLDGFFSDLPVGEYTVIAKFNDLQTKSLTVKVVK